MNLHESILSKLPEEHREKAVSAATIDELKALAKDHGIELSEEVLRSVSGGDSPDCGGYSCRPDCPDACAPDCRCFPAYD